MAHAVARGPRPRLAMARSGGQSDNSSVQRGRNLQDLQPELASRAEMDRLGEDVMVWDDPETTTRRHANEDQQLTDLKARNHSHKGRRHDFLDNRASGFQHMDVNVSASSSRSNRRRAAGTAKPISRNAAAASSKMKHNSRSPAMSHSGSHKLASRDVNSRNRRQEQHDRSSRFFGDDDDEYDMVENMSVVHNASTDRGRHQNHEQLSKASYNENNTSMGGISMFHDVVFPPLRTVLWDRTPLGDSCVLGTEAHIPVLKFRRAALASLYNDLASKTGYFSSVDSRRLQEIQSINQTFPDHQTPSLAGYAGPPLDYGHFGDWVGGAWEATLQSFHAAAQKRRLGQMRIFCAYRRALDEEMASAQHEVSAGGYEHVFQSRSHRSLGESTDFDAAEYGKIIRKALGKFRVQGPADPLQYLDGYAVCKALPGNRLVMRVETILPAITLTFTPITPLSILATPLARQLDVWAHAGDPNTSVDPTDPTACGFVTLNQTRKAVFLLEDDPMAYDLPIVGIWVRSAGSLNAKKQLQDWQDMLSEPFLWSACLRYIHNEKIQEKVSPPESPSTFLVVMYPPGSPMPQFVECSYSMYQDKETLTKLGVEPRPFIQVEAAFEVDVSMTSSTYFPQGDAVEVQFHHVESLTRRQSFHNAFDQLLQMNRERQRDQAHHPIMDEYLIHELPQTSERGARDQVSDLSRSRLSSRPPSPPTSTPPPPPPTYAPPQRSMQYRSTAHHDSLNYGDLDSMYFRPERTESYNNNNNNNNNNQHDTTDMGAFGGLFDDEDEIQFGNEDADNQGFDFRSSDPPAQQIMLSTIYGGNTTRLGDSIGPGPSRSPPLHSRQSRDQASHRNRGGSRSSRHRQDAPSYLTNSFDTSALGQTVNQSMASSKSRRSRGRSRHYYTMISTQQQQITLMQQQISGLQKLMEEQMRINSLSRAQTMALSAQESQTGRSTMEDGSKPFPSSSEPPKNTATNDIEENENSGLGREASKEAEHAPLLTKTVASLNSAMTMEDPTAIYLAGLQQYDEEEDDDDDEFDMHARKDAELQQVDRHESPSKTCVSKSTIVVDLDEKTILPTHEPALSRGSPGRHDKEKKAKTHVSPIAEPPSSVLSSGIGTTILRIPSNSTDDSSEPPSIIREEEDETSSKKDLSHSRLNKSNLQRDSSSRTSHRFATEQDSISNIYAEMDTEFGIPQIREVTFATTAPRRARLGSDQGGDDEDEEDDEDDEDWIAAVEAKYLKQARDARSLKA